MYENGKMRPVETIPGMDRGGIKENDQGMSSTTICCTNFCKCQNVPQYNNNIINNNTHKKSRKRDYKKTTG
jgi:hypothetical protein